MSLDLKIGPGLPATTPTLVEKAKFLDQFPRCIWITGLPCSGKTTLAIALEQHLKYAGKNTYLLDGDNLRLGLCRDLGFSDSDRSENIRRIAEVAKILVDAGLFVLVALV